MREAKVGTSYVLLCAIQLNEIVTLLARCVFLLFLPHKICPKDSHKSQKSNSLDDSMAISCSWDSKVFRNHPSCLMIAKASITETATGKVKHYSNLKVRHVISLPLSLSLSLSRHPAPRPCSAQAGSAFLLPLRLPCVTSR